MPEAAGAVGAERRGIDGAEHRSTLDCAMAASVPTQTSIRLLSRTGSNGSHRSTRPSPSPVTASVTGKGWRERPVIARWGAVRARGTGSFTPPLAHGLPPLLLVRAAHRAARSQHRSSVMSRSFNQLRAFCCEALSPRRSESLTGRTRTEGTTRFLEVVPSSVLCRSRLRDANQGGEVKVLPRERNEFEASFMPFDLVPEGV
jgi:hypothetical protein